MEILWPDIKTFHTSKIKQIKKGRKKIVPVLPAIQYFLFKKFGILIHQASENQLSELSRRDLEELKVNTQSQTLIQIRKLHRKIVWPLSYNDEKKQSGLGDYIE